MTKSLVSNEYKVLRQELIALRHRQGFTQRGLAKKIGVAHSWVSAIETGDRRIDLVEVSWICKALDLNPVTEVSKIMRKMSR